MRIKKAGATSEIWQIFVADSSSTTGAGLTGLVNNTSGLTAYYHRDTDTTATAISLITMTVGTFTSSGFKEIDATNMPGWYQFCPPNAAIASGAKNCGFHLKGATNMAPLPLDVQLTSVDPDSTTAFITGVNSLAPPTNWNSMVIDGSGRVDISKISGTSQTARDIGASVLLSSGTGTGQLDFTSGIAKANAVQLLGTAWLTPGTAGTPDVNAKLHGGTAQTGRDIGLSVLLSSGSGTGQVTLTAGAVNTVLTVVNGTVVTTNNDKTGYGLSAAAIQAVWDALTSALTTVGSIGKLLVTNIDTTISSRSTYSGGAVASVTAAVTVGTNNDKTGYALTAGEHTNIVGDVNTALDTAGTELSAIPSTTGTLRQKINYIFQKFRNKRTITSSIETMYKEDASTSLGTNTVADDGTTVTIGESN